MASGADIAAFKAAVPEFAGLPDPQLSAVLDETDVWLDARMWEPADFVYARWYLTAHHLQLAAMFSSPGSSGGGAAAVSSDLFVRMVAFGERRVMFGERKASTTEGQITGPGAGMMEDTVYGQKFLLLRSRNIPPILSV